MSSLKLQMVVLLWSLTLQNVVLVSSLTLQNVVLVSSLTLQNVVLVSSITLQNVVLVSSLILQKHISSLRAFCWKSKWTISKTCHLRKSEISTVKSKCSDADGYRSHKGFCPSSFWSISPHYALCQLSALCFLGRSNYFVSSDQNNMRFRLCFVVNFRHIMVLLQFQSLICIIAWAFKDSESTGKTK